MSSIGSRIKELREAAGLSMNKLEDAIGAPRGSVNKWEKGSVPGGNNLIALSEFFKVSTDWILKGGDLNPQPQNIVATEKQPLFFNDKREFNYHFAELYELLNETDRAFVNRYIQMALNQKDDQIFLPESSPSTAPIGNVTPKIQEKAATYSSPSAIPVLGRAAAGVPIEMVRFIEGYIRVADKFKNCFAVKVDGDSMVNAGIENGGYVVVRQQERVEDNEIALVMVDEGVTIKRFRTENGLAHLISENDGIPEMIYDPKEKHMQILGLVVDIIPANKAANLLLEEL
ncbi:helix-turn-helix domain-containing protein [Cohnella nanjingensis]|uniref:Helix-turn-helix domain-containing protein n=1 Tax=Cohnella nanjingensis TaxID=1387779 RepID=A0A7X0RSP5_9BACL|nr:LexA family transcriptional regulator [Cohnella nanjingensis]MBB6672987.1 helix-turn-helix domain-containing protein [Cohnella nanjingensis]